MEKKEVKTEKAVKAPKAPQTEKAVKVLDHSKQYDLKGTGKTVHMKKDEVFKNVNGSLAEVLVNSGKATIID
jgi:hypothetical protein